MSWDGGARGGLLLVVGLSALLAACVDTRMQDLKGFVAEVKARPKPPIQPLPEIKQIETFVYSASDLRNPFERAVEEEETATAATDSGIRPDLSRRKEELELYPLDSIRMVGTLEQDDVTWGLVRSSDGVIHRVRAGNYMGQNNGKITFISEEQIELNEIFKDGQGVFRERQASLALTE